MHVVRILPKANAYTSLLIIQRKHCWTGCSEVLPRLPRTKSADERIGRSIIGENTKSFVNPSAVILQLWLYRRQTGHYPVLGLVEWSHGAERASNDAVVSKTLSKNRTAGFPQYGFKVDLSSEAFPPLELLKPAPGIHNATDSSLSLFVSFKTETCTPVLSRAGTPFRCRHSSLTALPQRSSLRSGL